MSNHGLRRIFSLLLAVMMVCTLLPTAVFAEEGTEQPGGSGENVSGTQGVSAGNNLNSSNPLLIPSPQPNSTVLLHPATGCTPTGVKVAVGSKIGSGTVSNINGNDITVDLGKYNVNNDLFYLPLPEEIWTSVKMQYGANQTYVSWDGNSGSHKTPGTNVLLANGGNTAYYFNLGSDDGTSGNVWTFVLKYDANGGMGAPADQTYGTTDKYAKSHSFTIPTTVPTRDRFVFKGWSDTKDGDATHQPGSSYLVAASIAGYDGGTVTKTLYAVWEEEQPKVPDKPGAVVLNDLSLWVKFNCTEDSAHSGKTCLVTNSDVKNGYEISDPVKDSTTDKYTSILTVNPQPYFDHLYGSTTPAHTLVLGGSKTITLTYDLSTQKWSTSDGKTITFDIKCETVVPTMPANPTDDEITAATAAVLCAAGYHELSTWDLRADTVTRGNVEGDADKGYTCIITVRAQDYVDLYNKDENARGVDHTLTSEGEPTFTMKYVDGKWTGPTDPAVKIFVTCETVVPTRPGRPDKKTVESLLEGAVVIQCINEDANHGNIDFSLAEGEYVIGAVNGDADSQRHH